MSFIHKSPREYSSSHSFSCSPSTLLNVVAPAFRLAMMTFSTSNWFKRRGDCVATMTCVFLDATSIRLASNSIAAGCNPNSGSSMIIVDGGIGCRRAVARQMNRMAPSENGTTGMGNLFRPDARSGLHPPADHVFQCPM